MGMPAQWRARRGIPGRCRTSVRVSCLEQMKAVEARTSLHSSGIQARRHYRALPGTAVLPLLPCDEAWMVLRHRTIQIRLPLVAEQVVAQFDGFDRTPRHRLV